MGGTPSQASAGRRISRARGIKNGPRITFRTLISCADAALYRAKDAGPNRIETTERASARAAAL